MSYIWVIYNDRKNQGAKKLIWISGPKILPIPRTVLKIDSVWFFFLISRFPLQMEGFFQQQDPHIATHMKHSLISLLLEIEMGQLYQTTYFLKYVISRLMNSQQVEDVWFYFKWRSLRYFYFRQYFFSGIWLFLFSNGGEKKHQVFGLGFFGRFYFILLWLVKQKIKFSYSCLY